MVVIVVASLRMGTASSTLATVGFTGRLGWAVGGILGGAVGAVAFGLLVWVVDPAVLESAIPAIYGLEPAGVTGWAIHIGHGVGLGLIFGLVATRRPVLSMLTEDVETDALARTGIVSRIVGLGFVFGLAVWAVLPLIVLPVWVEVAGMGGEGEFPVVAVESLLGHLVFGVVLGIVFATTVDVSDRIDG